MNLYTQLEKYYYTKIFVQTADVFVFY